MKLFYVGKDGGKESTVWGYWLIEAKKLFSIALLRFEGKSREAYHTHAFNSVSWVLKGKLTEHRDFGKVVTCSGHEYDLIKTTEYKPSFFPVFTTRDNLHKVDSDGTTIVLTFRGPWIDKWKEFLPELNKFVSLTHGRKIVDEVSA